MKTTPLYERHKQLGGKIVTFAGWELPVQYQTGVVLEHHTTRNACGLFDVSHMGEIFVTGPEAEKALQYLSCNDVSKLYDGKALYSAILNEKGGVVDDIIIYRYSKEKYLVCVNASNADKDFAWFTKYNTFDAKFENKSAEYGQIAIQGPNSVSIIKKFPELKELETLEYFHFKEVNFGGAVIIAARTGYTGEDGFEFFIPKDSTVSIWNALLEAGQGQGPSEGLIPCGLGARDSLRLEACYPLHGHELGDDIPALESGLAWIIKFDKGDFIGKDSLLRIKQEGVKKALVGFYLDDAGIAREQLQVFSDSTSTKSIGVTTSGTKTPTVQKALGLAIIDSEFSKVGSSIYIDVRGKKLKASVVAKPFYKKPQSKI